MQAVAEAWRNVTATGARPLAITDNMNFGNPEKPEIMGQFAAAVAGMRAACLALDFPVVSGNVSLYNETEGTGILPTPAIGGLGVLEDAARSVGLALKPGQDLVLIGSTAGWLGQSLWLREIAGREDGAPPSVDLQAERRNGDWIRKQIQAGRIAACHDVSDGGLLIAVAEMALAGDVGVDLLPASDHCAAHGWWFGEDQSRYVIAVAQGDLLVDDAIQAGLTARLIGRAHHGRGELKQDEAWAISLMELRTAHTRFFPQWMDG